LLELLDSCRSPTPHLCFYNCVPVAIVFHDLSPLKKPLYGVRIQRDGCAHPGEFYTLMMAEYFKVQRSCRSTLLWTLSSDDL
jgi:hypothetical protein